MKKLIRFIFILFILLSVYFISECSIAGEKITSEAKIVIQTKISINDKYKEEQNKKLKNEIINIIYDENKEENPSISKYKIKRSFISALNRTKDKENLIYEEYYTVVALILAVMEIESNYNEINNYNNNGTIDYGVMQINSLTIPEIEEEFEELDIKESMNDNIEAGSYQIYECYKKASEKHPNDILFYTYNYYNRGLYFEDTASWKNGYCYNQAYKRSSIFIKKYYKYYNLIEKVFDNQKGNLNCCKAVFLL